MKQSLFVLVIFALLATARAGGDWSTLLRCEINLGGNFLSYRPGSEAKNKRENRLNHIAGIANPDPVWFIKSTSYTAKKTYV